ncbi:MAG: MFS transporter [Lentisphaeria bacterium]|jgi:FSR family fosmidomycin resistance protein-like MFS transporter
MSIRLRSWLQLLALSLAHIMVDMVGGMLPAILPAVREQHGLSLRAGVALVTILNLACNVAQLGTGPLRARQARPLFIPLGLLLAGVFCLLGFVPAGVPAAFPLLAALLLVAGTGVAMVHPEALRGTHAIAAIPGAVSTPLFMVGGFFGFAAGAWLGALLVQRWGFGGLLAVWLPLLAAGVLVRATGVRLAVELGDAAANVAPPPPVAAETTFGRAPASFWHLFAVATPLCSGAAIFVGLLATRLKELQFSLAFGGFSSMLYGFGTAAGAVGLGVLGRRFSAPRLIKLALAAGLPVLAAYLLLLRHGAACWLAFPAGLLLGAGYPQLVALARTAGNGPGLGMRMAWMVGGAWGAASLLLLAAGQLADRASVQAGLAAGWGCYAATLFLALLWLRTPRPARRQPARVRR